MKGWVDNDHSHARMKESQIYQCKSINVNIKNEMAACPLVVSPKIFEPVYCVIYSSQTCWSQGVQ